MLVPSMTLEEIRREITKDFPIVFRKASYVGNKVRKAAHPKRDERYGTQFDYLSKYKNNWICNLEVGKKEMKIHCMAHYYAELGLAGVGLLNESDWLMFFTSHFFKRFRERLKLNIIQPLDLLHHYMATQNLYVFHKIRKLDDKTSSMFCVSESGVILGVINEQEKFYRMNTFLTSDMLGKSRAVLESNLKLKLLVQQFKEWSPGDL
jgi:hypothetical protein